MNDANATGTSHDGSHEQSASQLIPLPALTLPPLPRWDEFSAHGEASDDRLERLRIEQEQSRVLRNAALS